MCPRNRQSAGNTLKMAGRFLTSRLPAVAFVGYWATFVAYYATGFALSSIWQMTCKIGINATLLLLAVFALQHSAKRFEALISLAAVTFFAGVTVFYLLALLLFNFFEMAINDYVGYAFLLLLAVSLLLSTIITYGRKKQL